mgnify:CR=1 FL=1
MDEGLNTYSTARTLAKAYPDEWIQTPLARREFDGRPLLTAAEPPTALARLLTLQALAPPTLRIEPSIPIFPSDAALRWYRELPFLNYVPVRRPAVDGQRERYLSSGYKKDRMDRPSFLSVDGEAYGHNSYYKPAMALHTLERIVGPAGWARAMRAYAARFRFQHPRPEDFFDTLIEFGGAEFDGARLSRFLQQVFNGSDGLDYGVASASNRELTPAAGWFGHGADRKLVSGEGRGAGSEGHQETLRGRVRREPQGEVTWPVLVEWKREGKRPRKKKCGMAPSAGGASSSRPAASSSG